MKKFGWQFAAFLLVCAFGFWFIQKPNYAVKNKLLGAKNKDSLFLAGQARLKFLDRIYSEKQSVFVAELAV